MNSKWFSGSPNFSIRGLELIRVAVALVLVTHPIHGLLHPADITGFGGFLGQIGFPFGVALAWLTILIQIACSLALVLRRFVVPASIGHIGILGMGIWLVHAPSGWFVVGASTGGMEFSVTLIACLSGVMWAYWPSK